MEDSTNSPRRLLSINSSGIGPGSEENVNGNFPARPLLAQELRAGWGLQRRDFYECWGGRWRNWSAISANSRNWYCGSIPAGVPASGAVEAGDVPVG